MNFKELSIKENTIKQLVTDEINKAKKNGIDQVEIFCSYSNSNEISLEKNDINTSSFAEETMYGVRVIADKCQGFVATNDSTTLYDSILEAKSIALSQGTPDVAMTLPSAGAINDVAGLYDLAIDEITPEKLLAIVTDTLESKKDNFPKVNIDSGDFAISKSFKLVANSLGVSASEKEGALYASYMGMAVDGDKVGSFDYDSAYGREINQFKLNLAESFNEFLENCMRSLEAIQIEGFKGKIIIPPRAIQGFLLGDLISSLTAPMIRKGKSKFVGKINQPIVSELISLNDNPLIPNYLSSTSFDREGQPTRNINVIENGILQNYFYNTFEANKAGIAMSSGSALGGASSTPSCGPRQLQLNSGNTSLKEIMNSEAILLNRFSGSTDNTSGDFSGVVKGGFLLKNNEKIPVKEIQIAGNIYQSLNEISAVSKETKLIHSSSLMPWVVIENIDITGI